MKVLYLLESDKRVLPVSGRWPVAANDMKTKELRLILEHISHQEDENRILIAIDEREWEIDAVRQEYTGGEDCTIIDARIGLGRMDLQLRPSILRRMKRAGSAAPATDQENPCNMGKQDQTWCKTPRMESQRTAPSSGVLSRIGGWLGIGRRSFCGEGDGVLTSQTNVPSALSLLAFGIPPAREANQQEACRKSQRDRD